MSVGKLPLPLTAWYLGAQALSGLRGEGFGWQQQANAEPKPAQRFGSSARAFKQINSLIARAKFGVRAHQR
jgi:hypothetical protein